MLTKKQCSLAMQGVATIRKAAFQVPRCLWAPRIAPHVTITLVMLETINAWEKKMGF